MTKDRREDWAMMEEANRAEKGKSRGLRPSTVRMRRDPFPFAFLSSSFTTSKSIFDFDLMLAAAHSSRLLHSLSIDIHAHILSFCDSSTLGRARTRSPRFGAQPLALAPTLLLSPFLTPALPSPAIMYSSIRTDQAQLSDLYKSITLSTLPQHEGLTLSLLPRPEHFRPQRHVLPLQLLDARSKSVGFHLCGLANRPGQQGRMSEGVKH